MAEEHAELADQLALQPNVFDDVVSYHLDSARKAAARATRECARQRQQTAQQCLQLADTLAQRAQSQLALAQEDNAKLQSALAQLRGELATQGRCSLVLQAWAGELEQLLLATRRSTSWRVTSPLRLAGALPRRLRALLRRLILRASASERLRRLLIPVLLRFPGQIAHISKVLADIRQPAPPPIPDLPDELRAMPAEARRVLDDLQRACRRD